jgi:hypothetical protein
MTAGTDKYVIEDISHIVLDSNEKVKPRKL